jgi:DNA-binding CsgD family transcriptional regulator/predicted SnoaL-like aldol condensation-catalyzing enzyme
MDSLFSWRKTQAGDLAECLQLHPAKNGAEIVGQDRAIKAWKQLLEMSHATRSAVVEMRGKDHVEIVGFGFGSFVKKSFAEKEVSSPRPGLNSRIIQSIAEGNSVIATYAEVRDSNTRGDLQQVILDTSWKSASTLTAAQVDEVRILLGLAYQELFAGYHFSRILSEMVDELDLWHVRGQRYFRIVSRFKEFRRANPESKWNAERLLLEVTLDSIRADPHSIAAGLFRCYVTPQLGLKQKEQELLELAVEGADDRSIAKSLFVTLPAVKHRWSSIFERVSSVRPDLCPFDGGGTRGVQKRQRILAYIRTHPEELRPFKQTHS